MLELTQRQQQVLDVIRRYIDETGFPPTRADIAEELGFRSVNAAEEHIKALARKEVIEVIAGASRGIRLAQPSGIPVVGHVAAGSPILAEEHIDEYCDLPPSFFRPAADYFLRVRGDSMTGAGILDGDLLAVHRTTDVRSGAIVVARLEGEVTVKRLKRGPGRSRLQLLPENPDYEPIEAHAGLEDFAIEGIGVGVLRRDQ